MPLSSLRYGRGILAGLCELHSARIVMLDVKPSNVLLTEQGPQGQAVLTDFGISRDLKDQTRFKVGGCSMMASTNHWK